MEHSVGGFQLRRRIGGGEHSEVWLADGPAGPVALKAARSLQGRQHLRLEAGQLQRLQHPALPRLLGADPDGAWNALEHIPAPPTRRLVATWGLAERVDLIARLAETLGELHERGMVHSNLKPGHILVDPRDGRVRLLDLGGGPAAPGFRAPEALDGGFPGPAADTYAFGAIAYLLLTGQGPFPHADGPEALDHATRTGLPLPPSSLSPRISAALDEAVLRTLAHRPVARPRSLSLLARALRAAAEAPPSPAVVGMDPLRRLLRQRLLAALQGHGPGVVALVGAPGVGKSALIAEVMAAARREQCSALPISPRQDRRTVLDGLRRGPFAATLTGPRPDIERLIEVMHAERLPGLLLLEAGPTAEVPAAIPREDRLVVPSLEAPAVAALLDLYGLDPDRAGDVVHMTRGLPRVVLGHIRRQTVPTDVAAAERALLLALHDGVARPISRLGLRMGLDEAALLALALPLLRRGLLVRSADGTMLGAAPLRPAVSSARRGSDPASG